MYIYLQTFIHTYMMLLLSCFSHVWLCNPMHCSPPGYSVHGILEARVLEWAVILPSRGSSWRRDRTWASCIAGRFFTTEPLGKSTYIHTYIHTHTHTHTYDSPSAEVKNLPANAGDVSNAGSTPRSGRPSGEGTGNPLQYSCLENPMDRGAWQATVHGVAKSWTWPSD